MPEAVREAVVATPEDDSQTRWNFPVMAGESAIFSTGMAWADAGLVLPVFIRLMGGSPVLVGLVTALQRLGYMLPQLPVAALVGHRPERKPYLRWGVLIGRMPFLAFVLYLWLAGFGHPAVVLTLMMVGYFSIALGNGFVAVPWQDIIAKSIPAPIRGRFFGVMQFTGAVLVFLVGLAVRWALSKEGPGFPRSYLVLFTMAALFFTFSTAACWIIREPIRPVLDQPDRLRELIGGLLPFVRRHRGIGGVILVGLLGYGLCMTIPFYTLYATGPLRLAPQLMGVYLAISTIGNATSSAVWAHLNDRYGPRVPIRCSSVCITLVPVLALLLPIAARGLETLSQGLLHPLPYLFALLFLIAGSCMSGLWMGINNYVFDLSSHEERHRYIAIVSTLSAPGALLPLLIGVALGFLPYPVVFGGLAVLGAAVLVLARRLPSPQ